MVEVRCGKRIRYSFVAWLAGQAALGLLVFFMSLFGGSHAGLSQSLAITATYLMFSLVVGIPGWILIGLPVALFWPAAQLRKLPYYVVLLIGIAAGPMIVLLVLGCDALAHGERISGYLPNSGIFFICAAIVAPVCCLVYKLLLRLRPIPTLSASPIKELEHGSF
jgi:hypothetical protein